MGSVASALEGPAGGVSEIGGRIDEIDVLRAEHYDLLAVLLGRAPEQALLDGLAALGQGEGALGAAVAELRRAAAATDARTVEREFFELFIGVGRGELLPYASYYLTGFLNERPLARVREDLASLGLARVAGMSEPEDHLAFLLEIVAGLAAGRFGAESGAEKRFFVRHVGTWAPRFFSDLETAKAARFYRAVGGLGRVFLEVEAEAFRMDA
jgi:TorA maturation chaperone TorD